MLRTKLLLISLFSLITLTTLIGQITVHGTVTNVNGDPEENVNILISAIFSDSTTVFESVLTGADGTYEVEFASPPPNVIGYVDVSMVDCWGTLISQGFPVSNGAFDLQADFVYCQPILIDSCSVTIIEEWVPGALTTLFAWTGINAPVDYLWSTGETTSSIVPQGDGQYCVTVTFPWGCTAESCYDFVSDSSWMCFSYIHSELNNDGTYNLTAISYGTGPFEYLWDNGSTGETINNVGPGTYCVTVTDSTGCSYPACVYIDNGSFCEVYILCDPSGALVAQGYGQPPFNYLWNTGEVTESIFPNEPGTYCVTVTDANQCSASSCFYYGGGIDSCFAFVFPVYIDSNTIGLQAVYSGFAQSWSYLWNTGETTEIIQPQDPNFLYCVTITGSDGCVATACYEPINWCYAWVDLQYIDTTTAVITAYTDPIYNWGNPPVSYLWSNGATTETITVSESGTYCVTVTLNSECVTEACVYVDFESLINECSAWVVQYTDSTGQWYAEVLAWGYGTFTYEWTTGETTQVIPLDFPNQYVCVTATSSFGCVTEACVDTFYNPCQSYISVNYIGQDVAILDAYNWNVPPFNSTYVWSTGDTGPTITVNQEGTYCVTVTGNGCISEACVDVIFWQFDSCGVYIVQEKLGPDSILYTAEAWGVAPFEYSWSNGATTPSIVAGTDLVCVSITDAVGCTSLACSYPGGGVDTFNLLSGLVFGDTLQSLRGIVYAYAMDPNGITFELTDSVQFENGFYRFTGLPAGLYVVRAEIAPGTVGYTDYMPTYHLSSPSWETALPAVVPNWLPVTTDIWMLPIDTSTGSGVIGGVISDPQHLTAEADSEFRGGEGISGVTIILSDAEGKPLNYKISIHDGSFRFTGLPFGTYRISYDIPGIYSQEVWVTLTHENPERLQVSLVISQGEVVVDEPEVQQVELYPNPAKDQVTIELPGDNADYHIQVVDMQGRIVKTGSAQSENGIMLIEVGQYSPGLYHVNLKGETTYYFGRFVKQE